LEPDAWEKGLEFEEGEIIRGKISRLTDFGAFVDLGGADGLDVVAGGEDVAAAGAENADIVDNLLPHGHFIAKIPIDELVARA
jgi:hypothetical protein